MLCYIFIWVKSVKIRYKPTPKKRPCCCQNVFPEMGVKWSVHPNHLGHLETIGCDRCHNDLHKSESGKVISRDCNLCHNIVAQGPDSAMQISSSFKPLEFKHPVDIKDEWKTKLCSECHAKLY